MSKHTCISLNSLPIKKNPTKIFLKIDDTQEMMNLRNKQHKTVLFSPL